MRPSRATAAFTSMRTAPNISLVWKTKGARALRPEPEFALSCDSVKWFRRSSGPGRSKRGRILPQSGRRNAQGGPFCRARAYRRDAMDNSESQDRRPFSEESHRGIAARFAPYMLSHAEPLLRSAQTTIRGHQYTGWVMRSCRICSRWRSRA